LKCEKWLLKWWQIVSSREKENPPRKEPTMKKILRIGKGVKVRGARVNEICELPSETMNVDVKAELIQMLIPIGLLHVKKLLEEEVRKLAGERYKRSEPYPLIPTKRTIYLG
jgi:hypothetical protein